MKHVEKRPAQHIFVHTGSAAADCAAALSPDGSLFPFSTPHPNRFLTGSHKVSFSQNVRIKENA